MSRQISRREFTKLCLAGVAGLELGLSGMPFPTAFASRAKRVVVIGGGFGGAAAAKFLRIYDPSIEVTLIEPKAVFHTCPMSNWVLGGLKSMAEISHDYQQLAKRCGVKVICDRAVSIDPRLRRVRLGRGGRVGYDRLVVSPGIDFLWDAIPGYSEKVAMGPMPHAYEAGTQTELLRRQLLALPDGANVLVCAPQNQFRCPAAPYERAGMIAMYLKGAKPKSKVIILDAKDGFTKQDLFMQGWERRYPGMIEWRSGSGGGKVEKVDAATMTVSTEFGDEKGGVINVIPPQRAGRIALDSGLADLSGWCPVNPLTFESTRHEGIHVIGDAVQGNPMPKSGTAAHAQGRIVAAVIAASLGGKTAGDFPLSSLCYSLIAPGYAVSVKAGFTRTSKGFVDHAGDSYMTPMDATTAQLEAEASHAELWYQQITRDTWR